MPVTEQTNLSIIGISFPKVTFNASAPMDPLVQVPLELQITPKVFFPPNQRNIFNIIMEVRIREMKHFELEVVSVSMFSIAPDTSEETRNNFINRSAPAIAFPYVRAFIATLSANLGGMPALVIPPQFFKDPVEEIKTGEVQQFAAP
jgi:preprotein translocase subunit SecB